MVSVEIARIVRHIRSSLKPAIRRAIARFLMYVVRIGGTELYSTFRLASDELAKQEFLLRVKSVGRNPEIRHPIYIKNSQYFQIGNDFVAGPGLRIEAWEEYGNSRFSPRIWIGNRVVLNWNVHIGAINRIEIHDDVLIGSNVLITDHAHGSGFNMALDKTPISLPLRSKGPVIIEANVWIGEGVCILPGVKIGKGAMIGANAVVTSDVGPGIVVGGIPARPLICLAPH